MKTRATIEQRQLGWTPASQDTRSSVPTAPMLIPDDLDLERVIELSEILSREGQKYPVVCAVDGRILAGAELVAAANTIGWSRVWAVDRNITPEILRAAWQEERKGLFLSIAPIAGRNQWAIKVVPTRERSEVICEDGPGPWEEVALKSFRRAESSFMRLKPLSTEQIAAGERLLRLRQEMKLEQREVEAIVDYSQNYISELENGKYSVERINFVYEKLKRYRDLFGAA